jgi:GNAT superfamily N-acetyltransferase
VTIKRATAADEAELVALYRAVHPGSSFGEALYRWRYRDVPGGPASIFVVRESGRIAAQLVLMPRDITVAGGRRPGWLIVDVMTHPEHRGRGHLRRLATFSCEEARRTGRIAFGYPNAQSEHTFSTCGFAVLGHIPSYSAPVEGAAREWKEKSGPFGDEIERAWLRLERIGVHRDAAVLNWRLARPDARYHVLVEGERILVLKRYRDSLINLCDLLMDPGDERGVEFAVQAARAFGQRQGARILTTWIASEDPYRAALQRAGFTPDANERIVIIEAPDALAGVKDERRWHMAQLDSDVF